MRTREQVIEMSADCVKRQQRRTRMKAGLAVRLGMAIAASFAVAVAGAQGPGGPGGSGFGMHRPPMERAMHSHGEFGRWWNNPKIVEKLKLNEDQRKAMDDIFQKHREKLVDLRANLEKAEIEMEPLVKAGRPAGAAGGGRGGGGARARAGRGGAGARGRVA